MAAAFLQKVVRALAITISIWVLLWSSWALPKPLKTIKHDSTISAPMTHHRGSYRGAKIDVSFVFYINYLIFR